MKCTQCGTEYGPESNGCPACGFGSRVKLTISGKSGNISVATDMEFGKSIAGRIVGDESRFMDDVQFFLKTRDEKWFIKPHPRQKNPIWLNNAELTTETELAPGDRLSLKNKAAFMDILF